MLRAMRGLAGRRARRLHVVLVLCAVCLVVGSASVSLASGAGQGGISSVVRRGHPQLTVKEMRRARPLGLTRHNARLVGPSQRLPRLRAVVSSSSPRTWAPPRSLLRKRNHRAQASYGGPQPAFPIWWEGYWPPQNYDLTVGRLYAFQGNTVWMCTATVVGPNVILTAAHCVWNSSAGQYYSDWAFVPEMFGNARPYGVWWATRASMWTSYQQAPSESTDYAILTLPPDSNGNSIGQFTGWHGILMNSTQTQILSNGYPASGVFSKYCSIGSCYQWACYSPRAWSVQDFTGWWEVGMGCNSGEGSSGGPWFEPYNGQWYVASNVSTGVSRVPNPGYGFNQWGPYYNSSALTLLNYAKANG